MNRIKYSALLFSRIVQRNLLIGDTIKKKKRKNSDLKELNAVQRLNII